MPPMTLALATCAHHPGFVAGDDEALAESFERAGARAERARWDDASVDWASFDAVLLRTTWDYHERLAEFLEWCTRVDALTTLLNPLEIVRRNAVKTYLRDLDASGVPIVPTMWIDPEASDVHSMLSGALGASDSGRCIIKPVVAAGAMGLLEIGSGELDAAMDHVSKWLGHSDLMVQPMLDSIRSAGECSLVFVAGEFSHAMRKMPKAGDIRVQIELGGTYTVIEPTRDQMEVARGALDAQGAGALYARVDLVDLAPDQPGVMELELIEPELFFAFVEGSGERFVRAALRRLSSEPAPRC